MMGPEETHLPAQTHWVHFRVASRKDTIAVASELQLYAQVTVVCRGKSGNEKDITQTPQGN